jgi:hypothetical protein
LVSHIKGDHRSREFENRMLKRMFGPKRDEVTGTLRKVHDEFHNLYALPNIVRVLKSRRTNWVGHVACMGGNAYRILVRKHVGKRPFGRPRYK